MSLCRLRGSPVGFFAVWGSLWNCDLPVGVSLGWGRLYGRCSSVTTVGGGLLVDGLLGSRLVDKLGQLGLAVLAIPRNTKLRGDLVQIAQGFTLEGG
jgi:hypothetical protein